MFLNACKDIGSAVKPGKTKYMEIGRHRGMFFLVLFYFILFILRALAGKGS